MTSTTATPHSEKGCTSEERYECERCHKLVCYCNGTDGPAICDGCWGSLDRAGWTDGDMEATYPAGGEAST